MKISGTQRPAIEAAYGARRQAARGPANGTSKVEVSKEAKRLAEARAPAVSDAAKVARIAAAIARGDFLIDAERIAEGMMREES